MIFTAWYYTGSLAKGDLIIRDDRFYPGKYFETWPLWYAYIRKNYPNEHIVIFNDESSPIPLSAGLEDIKEPVEFIDGYSYSEDVKIHIKSLNKYAGRYFQAMQRNLCEGLIFAYKNNLDFLWIDNDAFLNSNLDIYTEKADVFAPQILDHQFTCDSVCTFISKKRLHELDDLIDLEEYLTLVLEKAPENVRIHTFQEGGLYKMFCYNKAGQLNQWDAYWSGKEFSAEKMVKSFKKAFNEIKQEWNYGTKN